MIVNSQEAKEGLNAVRRIAHAYAHSEVVPAHECQLHPCLTLTDVVRWIAGEEDRAFDDEGNANAVTCDLCHRVTEDLSSHLVVAHNWRVREPARGSR